MLTFCADVELPRACPPCDRSALLVPVHGERPREPERELHALHRAEGSAPDEKVLAGGAFWLPTRAMADSHGGSRGVCIAVLRGGPFRLAHWGVT